MSIITRFAPSPTGVLHIGGARTALFNYLFARKYKGKFLLRIEDTDKGRSKMNYVDDILQALKWMNINWDGDIVFQSDRIARHQEVALQLVKSGHAYYCFDAPKEHPKISGQKHVKNLQAFKSAWRDKSPDDYPKDIEPVVRLKVPETNKTNFVDFLKGTIEIDNSDVEDVVLLRQDKTPTYILSAAVDDHDMQISHIIRGEDHLTNTTKQIIIFEAMGWVAPKMVHIPLILDTKGHKLSKRHGAVSISEYKHLGYLPNALRNYILKLGWSHKDEEILSDKEQIKIFSLEGLNKAQAQFNVEKLNYFNHTYLSQEEDVKLVEEIMLILERPITKNDKDRILQAMPEIKKRVKTLQELAYKAVMYTEDIKIFLTVDAQELLKNTNDSIKELIIKLIKELAKWDEASIKETIKAAALQHNFKLADILKPTRAALTGQAESENIFKVIEILGKELCLQRLETIFSNNAFE
jgi:glutamyl-tRNA synthetase